MSIRSTCKAIVIYNGQILLNRCYDKNNGFYYSLPGGGQNTQEFLEEAIIREVREETGYTVIPQRFVGICEEICNDIEILKYWPDYTHKMYHIFLCYLDCKVRRIRPTEIDDMQEESVWINLTDVHKVRLLPEMVARNLKKMVTSGNGMYLGSVEIDHHHG